MILNDALIRHYRAKMVPISKLTRLLDLNEPYLREKPTWYQVGDDLKYFKIRGDLRLFSELFYSEFARIADLDYLDYEVAYVRTVSDGIAPAAEETKIGLLSNNFQSPHYNYYLVSEIMDSKISDFLSFGDYSLSGLLRFFHYILADDNYTVIETFLVRLFLVDAFLLQVDRNPHNIGFQIPEISGISYTQRLRPEILAKHGCTIASDYVLSASGTPKLVGLEPSKVYDNERILGIDHKNTFVHSSGDVWAPLFPFEGDLLFTSQEEAVAMQDVFDGMDPNLYSLISSFPYIKSLADRFANSDEYRRILEDFTGGSRPVALSPAELEIIENTIIERQQVFRRVLGR